jgi:hypothetical protein
MPATASGTGGGTPTPSRRRAGRPVSETLAGTAVAVGASSWSLVFGAVHLYWAFGGRLGLGDTDAADEAFQRPWFAAFNALAGVVLLALAAAVALGAAGGRVTRWDWRRRRAVLWAVGAVLLARGGIGVVQWLLSAPTEAEEVSPALALYDVWFLLGGGLYVALVSPGATGTAGRRSMTTGSALPRRRPRRPPRRGRPTASRRWSANGGRPTGR